MTFSTAIPESSKVIVTVRPPEAVDGFSWVVAYHKDFIELNQIIINDEDSCLRIFGLVI